MNAGGVGEGSRLVYQVPFPGRAAGAAVPFPVQALLPTGLPSLNLQLRRCLRDIMLESVPIRNNINIFHRNHKALTAAW